MRLPISDTKVIAGHGELTIAGTGLSKTLPGMIKERVTMTVIRPIVIKVKEKRGAIFKIAPRKAQKVIRKTTNIITKGRVCGANSEIAPEETTKLIAEEAIRGAIYKIAPENLRKLITETLSRGAISQIAPQTATRAIIFVRELVTKTAEISTKPAFAVKKTSSLTIPGLGMNGNRQSASF